MKAVILAGGRGTRLNEGTKNIPAALFINTFSQLPALKSIQKTVQLENFLTLLILTRL